MFPTHYFPYNFLEDHVGRPQYLLHKKKKKKVPNPSRREGNQHLPSIYIDHLKKKQERCPGGMINISKKLKTNYTEKYNSTGYYLINADW